MGRYLGLVIVMISLAACGEFNTDPRISTLSSLNSPGTCKGEPSMAPKVLYGEDDRLDWHSASGIERNYWAKATFALMTSDKLTEVGGGDYLVTGRTYGRMQNLCESVPFYNQPAPAYCSGFIVGDNLAITAGHCMRNDRDCRRAKIVFDFAKTSAGQSQYMIGKNNVYGCKKIVKTNMREFDYAVIELDRPVLDRVPLNIRRKGKVKVGEELVLIGHPAGIPSKIADGGIITASGKHIVAGVDAFAGNSGSAVINAKTGVVEGILVQGEEDYVMQNDCRVENRCDGNCKGEIITPISKIMEFVPDKTYEVPQICE